MYTYIHKCDGGKETREEGSRSWNLVGSRITERCVELITVNERLLGGNPVIFNLFCLHLVYLLLAIVCVLSLFNIEKKGFINFAEEVNKKEL